MTVCDSVLDFVETLGCKFIVTMGGVPITEDKTQVYIAATRRGWQQSLWRKAQSSTVRAELSAEQGLTLALAKERKIDGISLLGTTMGFKADRGRWILGFQVFNEGFRKRDKRRVSRKQCT